MALYRMSMQDVHASISMHYEAPAAKSAITVEWSSGLVLIFMNLELEYFVLIAWKNVETN